MNIVTWNMQGGNASTEVKWQTGVGNMLTNLNPRPDFVCVQEAGVPPASAEHLGAVEVALPGGGGFTQVDYYAWGGTRSRPAHSIAFHHWDELGNRVNTAIVSNTFVPPMPPISLLWGPGPVWRPAVAWNVGGGWVFSFHAISPGGPDAAGTVGAIPGLVGGAAWVIGGDFNREPNSFAIPGGSVFCPPGGNTYSVTNPTRRLDYCVSSVAAQGPGTVLSLIMSDHYPVAFAI